MIKRIIPAFLSVVLLAASIVYVADKNKKQYYETDKPGEEKITEPEKPIEETRGVWVTYMTLDVENEADKESAFKSRIDSIILDMQSANLNTMIVQVRPFCDAIYPSRYYPWSHILTGTQGEDPGYDPLEYIVNTAHESNIAVHAWINPYRITLKDTPNELSRDNPYYTEPSACIEINDCLYLNPSSEEAVELITNGVKEIMENYDVDGIQFDDYFYPPDCGDFDSGDYEAYINSTGSQLTLEEFRKDNVNKLLSDVYNAVHKINESAVFGVSPQGNLSNNEGISADVVKWCTEAGYIDYICPQIYFSLDNPALTFEDSLDEWLELNLRDDLAFFVGIPAYKAGTDADSGTWLDNNDILITELEIVRERTDGFMLYSYDSFHNEDNAEEVQNVINYLNTTPTQ